MSGNRQFPLNPNKRKFQAFSIASVVIKSGRPYVAQALSFFVARYPAGARGDSIG
jgi:hypothetical protein